MHYKPDTANATLERDGSKRWSLEKFSRLRVGDSLAAP